MDFSTPPTKLEAACVLCFFYSRLLIGLSARCLKNRLAAARGQAVLGPQISGLDLSVMILIWDSCHQGRVCDFCGFFLSSSGRDGRWD